MPAKWDHDPAWRSAVGQRRPRRFGFRAMKWQRCRDGLGPWPTATRVFCPARQKCCCPGLTRGTGPPRPRLTGFATKVRLFDARPPTVAAIRSAPATRPQHPPQRQGLSFRPALRHMQTMRANFRNANGCFVEDPAVGGTWKLAADRDPVQLSRQMSLRPCRRDDRTAGFFNGRDGGNGPVRPRLSTAARKLTLLRLRSKPDRSRQHPISTISSPRSNRRGWGLYGAKRAVEMGSGETIQPVPHPPHADDQGECGAGWKRKRGSRRRRQCGNPVPFRECREPVSPFPGCWTTGDPQADA